MPQHYVFLDEAYSRANQRKNIAMAAWAVDQTIFNRYVTASTTLYKTPVLKYINSMFESLDAWAVTSRASLDEQLFRPGETDGTDDVPEMARTDNIWSQCVIFVVGALFRELLLAGVEVSTVDIYIDTRSLKVKHVQAFVGTLRGVLVREAKRFASQLAQLNGKGEGLLRALNIRHVEFVAKAQCGQPLDKFQVGTWLADKLCSSHDTIKGRSFSKIKVYDMSNVVSRTVRQFDGISFYGPPSK